MRFFVLLLLIGSPAWASPMNFSREAEVPEPLLFDLVRRINSDKGELEINTLVVQDRASEMKETYVAPEIEYAFAKGKAIELELPNADGKVKTIKSALQLQIPNYLGDLMAVQIMYEKFVETKDQEGTLLLIMTKRFNATWSTLTMLGNRFVDGESVHGSGAHGRELPIVNHNIFYNYARNFDFGLEINLRGIGASFEELLVMPQIHALLAHDFKIQGGFGLSHDGYQTAPVSAFRFIKEFN